MPLSTSSMASPVTPSNGESSSASSSGRHVCLTFVCVLAAVWQNPYVEVIRYGLAHPSVGWQQHGDVEQITDPQIHKNVFKIRGTIAATNYVRFPRDVAKTNQGLGLTGRFVFIQLRRARGQQITLHLDLLTAKKTALRFSLSSMYSSLRSTGTVLRVPLDVGEKWTTIAVDMAELLQFHGFNGYSRETFRYLKAVTFCASLNLRNVFTSSTRFTNQTLPANLSLPSAHESQCGAYAWLSLPTALGLRKPLMSPGAVKGTDKPPGVEDGSRVFHCEANGMDNDGNLSDDSGDVAAVRPMRTRIPDQYTVAPAQAPSAAIVDTSGTGGPPLSPTSRNAGLIRDREDVLSRADQIMRDAGFSVPSPRRRAQHPPPPQPGALQANTSTRPRRYLEAEQSDWPDPILSLDRIIGFSSAFPRALRWLPDAQACVYTNHSTIILREFTIDGGGGPKTEVPLLLGNQPQHHHHQEMAASLADDHEVFLTGHTGEICCLEVSRDGALLASAQNAPQCVLRVWDLRRGRNESVLVIKSPTKSIHALAFAKDAASLCCVGSDDHARTQIFIWDSTSLLSASSAPCKLVLHARQTCDFPIHAIAFSPYESDQLVSCGKENVRFWRVNAARRHLPGSPVILNEYSRGTVFTDLAFDGVYPQFPSNLPRVRPLYVSSSAGSVLLIDYDTRAVVCVYQLHDAAIHSICVNEAFCVTGSDDKFLRVWPLDFSDFFLEAEHEAPVTSVDVSSDGMRVAVGTSSGTIGVLHLADQRYRTVMRSHTHPIHALAALPIESIVTSASDGTLRVWDTVTGTQTMEFDVSRDCVTCLTAMPSSELASAAAPTTTIAVGFRSGSTRIFSLGASDQDGSTTREPRVLHEFQQHQSPLCDVHYQSDGKTLYTSATGQQLCMHDASQGYAPVKMLIADMDATHGRICLSRDRRFLAVLQQGRRSALLLDAASLRVVHVLTPPQSVHTSPADEKNEPPLQLTHLVISWNSQELITISSTDRLFVFSLCETSSTSRGAVGFGGLLHSMPLLGQRGIASFALSPNLKYMATGGSDGSVRVWQCDLGQHAFPRMHQTFLLHAGAGSVRGLVFSAAGTQLIATSDSSAAAFVWRFRGNTSKLPVLELHADLDRQKTAHNPDFQLPLEGISNNREETHNHQQEASSVASREPSLTPVATVELLVSSKRVHAEWRRCIPGKQSTARAACYAWACGSGCLIAPLGDSSVVSVELLESGRQYFVPVHERVERVVLSGDQTQFAIISESKNRVLVCDLANVRLGGNQSEHEHENEVASTGVATRTVRLPLARGDELDALEFSVDNALLSVSGEISGVPSLFVLDIASDGQVVWWVDVSPSARVTAIASQSEREFLCVMDDDRQPLRRLHIPPFPVSSASLTLEPALSLAFPSKARDFAFRDDGAVASVGELKNDRGLRCRFGVAVDIDAYCSFFDLERQRTIHVMQLLLPTARAKILALEWIGTNEWQALVATLSGSAVAVFSLPTRFSFSAAKTRVAAVDWPQLVRTSRLSSARVLSFPDHRVARVLTDPLSDGGVVVTAEGAAFAVNFRSAQRRMLRAAPSGQLPTGDVSNCGLALDGAMVVAISGDRRAVQCWEPTIGRELMQFHAPRALCSCVSVSPFDSKLVVAGYDDGSLRLFDVKEQRLVTQYTLPPPTSSSLRKGRALSSASTSPAGDASPVEALSLLKQKQHAARHRASVGSIGTPPPTVGASNELHQLHFVGPCCVLATTQPAGFGRLAAPSRLVLFDLSDAITPSSSAADGKQKRLSAATGETAAPTKRKEKENIVHYREITLPAASDRPRAETREDRAMRVECVDVQHTLGCDSIAAKTKPRRGAQRDGSDTGRRGSVATQRFLVVVRLTGSALQANATTTTASTSTSMLVAYVFDASATAADHPVHRESDLPLCDSWVLPPNSSSSVLFHPVHASQVLYPVLEGPNWRIELRDFQAHTAILRLSVPAADILTEPICLRRWRVLDKTLVALLDNSTTHAVDLAKRVVYSFAAAAGGQVLEAGASRDYGALLSVFRGTTSSALVLAELELRRPKSTA